ncbi:MAG TPA: UMP kinase [Spirochaetota bacterium]|nr:UMP kinase [Spirochaetota bacterium]
MDDNELPRYRRILLKLSGEALAGPDKTGINPEVINQIAAEIKEVSDLGVEVALVIGAGNIFRGAMADSLGISRSTGDFMGMLATVMNSMAVENTLEKMNKSTRVLTAIEMKHVAEPYTIQKALDHLKKGRIVIAAGGTGHPYFTTDTAASLRAVELGADILLKATRVDGVYTGDPEKDSSAEKIEEISYIEMIKRQLRVMDLTAISLCMDNNLPIIVFNLFEKGSLKRIVLGESVGTKIF